MKTKDHHFYELESVQGTHNQTLSMARSGPDGKVVADGISLSELFRVLIDHVAQSSASRVTQKGDPGLEEIGVALNWARTNIKIVQEIKKKRP